MSMGKLSSGKHSCSISTRVLTSSAKGKEQLRLSIGKVNGLLGDASHSPYLSPTAPGKPSNVTGENTPQRCLLWRCSRNIELAPSFVIKIYIAFLLAVASVGLSTILWCFNKLPVSASSRLRLTVASWMPAIVI